MQDNISLQQPREAKNCIPLMAMRTLKGQIGIESACEPCNCYFERGARLMTHLLVKVAALRSLLMNNPSSCKLTCATRRICNASSQSGFLLNGRK